MSSQRRRIPTVAIVGHKNSGKTTLTERLIAAFTLERLRVCAIKHTSDEVGFDKPRTDSDRLKTAGAIAVGMVAKSEIGLDQALKAEARRALLRYVRAITPPPPPESAPMALRHAWSGPTAMAAMVIVGLGWFIHFLLA